MVALHRRDTAELLAEELRRLDPDEVYAETLQHVDVSPPAVLPTLAASGRVDGDAGRHDIAAGDDRMPRRLMGEEAAVSTPEVFVHASGDLLASAAAARTVTTARRRGRRRGARAHLVLTGGGIGTKVMAAIAAAPARDAVDWRRVDFWWGDERFEPTGDPERNETGARAALLDHLAVDPARVHAIAGPDGPDGDDPDAAAARYAAELAAAAAEPAPAGASRPSTC